MTTLEKAMNALHDIGGAYYARRALKQTNLTRPLRESMEAKALNDEAIEKLALDTWEEIVMRRHLEVADGKTGHRDAAAAENAERRKR